MPSRRRRRVRRRRALRAKQRGARLDAVVDVSRGNVPARNYLATHVAGVAQSVRRTLVWSYVLTTAISANTYQEYGWILNSPYDPDPLVGGASATGYAKYMAFYTKCFTLGARIKVKGAHANGTTFGAPNSVLQHGVTITTFTTSLGSTSAAISDGLCTYGLNANNPDSWTSELSVDIGKFLDKPDVLDDPELFATGSSNPTQIICAHTWWYSYASANTTGTLIIEIEFDVVFTDPQPFT